MSLAVAPPAEPAGIPRSLEAATTFLADLHDGADGYLAIWTPTANGTSETLWFPCDELGAAARQAVAMSASRNVYAGVSLQPRDLGRFARGTAATVSCVPGLCMDLDMAHAEAHKQRNLPPTRAAALDLVAEAIALKPTLAVDSGHGLQLYWLFREPWRIEHDNERRRISELNRRLQRQIQKTARAHGWDIESTADLARVLRVPGTWNRKPGCEPTPVRVIDRSGPRYLLDDLDGNLPDPEPDRAQSNQDGTADDFADFAPIMAGCGFVRYVRDAAPTVTEPEWHAAATIVGRCRDGEAIFHALSRPYPHYSADEAQSKIERARDQNKPFRCGTIEQDLNGGRWCLTCEHRGRIASPIVLGRPHTILGRQERSQNPQSPQNSSLSGIYEDNGDFENASEPAPWEEPTPLADAPRPAFPTDVLPAALGSYVEELARDTQTPAALPGMMTIAAAAVAAAKRVVVEIRPGWTEPTNVYAAIGLDSGNRKSAVTREVSAPIREHEQDLIRTAQQTIATSESERRILQEQLKRTEKRAADATGDDYLKLRSEARDLAKHLAERPEEHPPRLLADDVTPQKLAAMMADNGGRMGILSPEGGFFDILSGRYSKDGKSPDLQLFLMAHTGDDLPIDRLGREGEHLSAPALTLGMAVQTHVIRGLQRRPGFRGSGGLARIAYAMPESFVGRRLIEPDPISDEAREGYRRIILGIFALTSETEADGTPRARRLKLSEEAYRAFIAFATSLEPRLGPDGDLGHIADWASKLAGLVARIAGNFHTVIAVDQGLKPWEHLIDLQTVQNAIRLADVFLIPHALAAFAEMGIDPTVEAARTCRSAIARHRWETFGRRDLHQVLKRRYPNSDDLDAPLGLLVRHGYIRPIGDDGRESRRGRRPSPRFEVNPLWRSHNPHRPQNGRFLASFEDVEDLENVSGRVA